jgi:hypothetical protein
VKCSEPIPYKEYRKLAQVIHDNFCHDEACTYGRATGKMHMDDTAVLRRHVEQNHQSGCDCSMQLQTYDCQYAVDAENIAARVHLTRSGKVKIR